MLRVRSFFALSVLLLGGCGGNRSRSVQTSNTAIEVPPPPNRAENPGAGAEPEMQADRRPRVRKDDTDDDESLDFEITSDGGDMHIVSSGDGGVKFWGTVNRFDGGFSFQGGFSMGISTGDAGTAP